MANHSLIALFRELAQLAALDEGSSAGFRARAYENAVEAIASYPGDLKSLSERELTAIDGIGTSTAKKIREFFQRGTITKLEELRRKYPAEFVALGRIPGLGPKTLLRLRNELGVTNVETLAAALAGHKLRALPGLGVKTEQKILESIGRLGPAELGGGAERRRFPIVKAMPLVRELVAGLEQVPAVESVQYCGALRRLDETVARVDVVVASREAGPVRQAFVTSPAVQEVVEGSDDTVEARTATGLPITLRIVPPERFGAACLHYTGSDAHLEALGRRAQARGLTLDADGLRDDEGATSASSEEAIYAALGLPVIEPPVREGRGEIEAAESGRLPAPIGRSQMRGDLHVHTTLSGDGRSTLEEVLEHASELGYEYLAITDHAEDLAINGATRLHLQAQRKRIDGLRDRFPALAILQGAELNIDRDGDVDYDADFRRTLDWCLASVHSHFDLPRDQQTRRILAAMEDPTIHAIGHLSGRRIGTRSGIDLDVDAVLKQAERTGTAIEINAALARLDASSEVLYRARGMDVTFVISTDTHHVREFARMEWGVLHATRGWVDPARIANLRPRAQFLDWVASRRDR